MKQMKKLTFVLTVIAICFMLHTTASADEVIKINTKDELLDIGKDNKYPLDGDYVLTGDIDLEGISYVPIGTIDKPFSGTFDGAGYAIKNIEISGITLGSLKGIAEDAGSGDNVTGYGLFGVIRNDSDSDIVKISNLNICNAMIKDGKCNDTTAGILAAVVCNGVKLNNIAIIDSDIELIASKEKAIYGAGGLVGIVWTEKEKTPAIKTDISDIYTDCNIKATGFAGENTVSGVVGCVYNESIGSIEKVLSYGELIYNDETGYGIATSKKYDGNGIADNVKRAYYALANKSKDKKQDERQDNVIGNGIAKGVLASGKVALSDRWQQALGVLPVLKQSATYISTAQRIYPSLKRNQSIEALTENFFIPTAYDNNKIKWSSSSKNLIIDDTTGEVKLATADNNLNDTTDVNKGEVTGGVTNITTNGKAEKATLTYTCGHITGKLEVTIGEHKEICFDKSYVKAGETLKVLYAPDNATYKWEILNKNTNTVKTAGSNTNEYTVKEEDLESFIYVTINGKTKLSIYVSSLPVVYIDSDKSFSSIKKTSYYNGAIRLCGDSDVYAPWYLYEGDTEFKGRGHSSSFYEKNGLKLKLDKKSDTYGISGYESKHWVLVSNVLDGSLMRNNIVDRFYRSLNASSIMDGTDVILIYNGDYMGVYQLCEHVRIADGRVDIFDYSEFAKGIAKSIATDMVGSGKLSAHFEEEYADELQDIIESDYAYLKNEYVVDGAGNKHELKNYGINAPETTGGYLVCMDRYSTGSSSKQATLYSAYKLPFYIDKPDTDHKSQLISFKESAVYDYALNFNQTLEYAFHSDDFFFRNGDKHYKVTSEGSNEGGKWTGTTYAETLYRDDERDGLHYSQMVDMDSLVQNFLVCEFSQNYDSMKNSFYYQKDIGKLAVVAPFWDYDWSMGNWITTRYTNMPTKWQTTLDGACELFYQSVSWNRMLIRDPYFLLKVWEKYHAVRGDIEEIVKDGGFVDTEYERLKKASAANDLRWGHLDVFRSFEDSFKDLRNYLDKRVVWFDNQFATFDTLVESLGYYHASDYLEVTNVIKEKDGSATIEVKVNNTSVENVAFQVNGTYLVTVSNVKNGAETVTLTVNVPATELLTDSLNIVEVKAMDRNKNYIVNEEYSQKGNYNLIHSNYFVFE